MEHKGTQDFETERLVCRRFMASDYKDMFKNWVADPQIQFEYGEPVYTTISKVKKLLSQYITSYHKPNYYRWAIIEKKNNVNIGQIAFCKVFSDCQTAEIEYCIGKSFWGNGYASEALSGLIDFVFKNTNFIKLEAYHRNENIKSGKVLKKSVMHMTDTVERFKRENKSPCDEVCYCITKEEYKSV